MQLVKMPNSSCFCLIRRLFCSMNAAATAICMYSANRAEVLPSNGVANLKSTSESGTQNPNRSRSRSGSHPPFSRKTSKRHSLAVLALGESILSVAGLPEKSHLITTRSRAPSTHSTSEEHPWQKHDDAESASKCSSCLHVLQQVYEKSRVKHLLPLIILVSYSFLGGAVFYALEAPPEKLLLANKTSHVKQEQQKLINTIHSVRQQKLDTKHSMMVLNEAVYWYSLSVYVLTMTEHKTWAKKQNSVHDNLRILKLYTDQLTARCWEISIEHNEKLTVERKLEAALKLFEEYTGVRSEMKPVWTFWNALFLAMTTYTTIGYGNVAPQTASGKLAAIVYASFGIPMFLMILHKLGHLFFTLILRIWNSLVKAFQSLHDVDQLAKFQNRAMIAVPTDENRTSYNIPVSLAIGVTFSWLFVCAAIYRCFETDWDYFKSFYFVFISLTTIGYGDVIPSSSKDMFFTFGLIVIGLSLVSMCINVVQMKLESLFEDLMLMLMEEYESAQIEGGVEGPPPNIEGNVGLLQMWRLWNKQRRRSHKIKRPNINIMPSGASKLWLGMLSRSKKNVLIDQLKKNGKVRVKSTQTDPIAITELANPCRPSMAPTFKHDPLQRHQDSIEEWRHFEDVQEDTDEEEDDECDEYVEDLIETELPEQKPRLLSDADIHLLPFRMISTVANTIARPSNTGSNARPSNLHLAESQKNQPLGPPTVQSTAQKTATSENTPESLKSWTFVSTKAPRGFPRGLVPAREARKVSTHFAKDSLNLKALPQEIDFRLMDIDAILSRDNEPNGDLPGAFV